MKLKSNWSDTKSHEGGGNAVQCYSCVKWECYVNISKNNLGEVEMASEGSDTTNSP